MPDYGLLESGFVPKTFEIVVGEIEADIFAEFGITPRGFLKKLIDIFAERITELWELAQASADAVDVDAAVGAQLEALAALTGTLRNGARESTVVLTLTGDDATVVDVDTLAKTAATEIQFVTLEEGTLADADAWAPTTAYVVGDFVTNVDRVYICSDPGTSAGSGGPTTTGVGITDSTVEWDYVGEGTAYAQVDAQAVDTGPLVAVARTITEPISAVVGWHSVINLLDADVGRDIESNGDLRIRRELELAQAGSGTADSIRAALLEVNTVISVTVFVNDTDATDVDGLPPHSVEALVRDGDADDIAAVLLDEVAAGVQTFGGTTGSAEDDEGTVHVLNFTRPDEIEIYARIEVDIDAEDFPDDGSDQIEAAVVTWGDTLSTGRDARPSHVAAQAFQVDGVLGAAVWIHTGTIATPSTWTALTAYVSGDVVRNVARLYICTGNGTSAASGGPTTTGAGISDGSVTWEYLGDTIAIALRELAVFDTSRITVATTVVTP